MFTGKPSRIYRHRCLTHWLLVVVVALSATWSVSLSTAGAVPANQRASNRDTPLRQGGQDAILYSQSSLSDVFGGVWVDEKANRAHILLTNTDPKIVTQIARNIRHPELAVYDRAQHTEKDLLALKAKIWANRATLAAQGIPLVSVGEKTDHNKLLVEVHTADPAAVALLNTLYGGDEIEIRLGVAYPQFVQTTQRNIERDGPPPYMGGMEIDDTTRGFCTMGFMSTDSAGASQIITAGHCFPNGDNVYHNTANRTGVSVGTAHDSGFVYGSDADATLVSVSVPVNYQIITSDDPTFFSTASVASVNVAPMVVLRHS